MHDMRKDEFICCWTENSDISDSVAGAKTSFFNLCVFSLKTMADIETIQKKAM